MSLSSLVIIVSVALPQKSQTLLETTFTSVHYHPDGDIPAEAISRAHLWLCGPRGLPTAAPEISTLPRLKLIQLVSAGADKALASPQIAKYAKDHADEDSAAVSLATASGIHVLSIPNYAIAMMINIYHQIPRQIFLGREHRRWAEGDEVDQSGEPVFFNRKTRGRTVGLLGYGALGRETARLCHALGMNVIAANTSGKASRQDGYVIPGTGDVDGSIPSQYYSTSDEISLSSFLRQTDVLVSSLPGTEQTIGILDRNTLALLPKGAVFINVGRGSVIKSEELAAALDVPGHLLGAAIDVTDPEPLPRDHSLWSHPKLLITPHLSGDTEGELDLACEVFVANAHRVVSNEKVYNKVGFARGY